MLILAYRNENVLYFIIEQIDVPSPTLHFAELDVLFLVWRRLVSWVATRKSVTTNWLVSWVLGYHLHEKWVENMDFLNLFLC